MKIAILSRQPRAYSTRRMVEAAKARDHKVKVLDTMKFSIEVDPAEPDLYYRNKVLSSYDAVIPRIGASVTFFGTAVVRQFEMMGVYTLATSDAILRSRDKLRCSQILASHRVQVPETIFVRDKADILPAIRRIGGAPVIIKLLEGTQGIGVILADSEKIAEAIIETLQSTQQNVLLQKFVAESMGKDVRAFVVGDEVVAAMRRSAVGEEFRSNVHRGGQVQSVELDEEYRRAAVRAAQIVGLGVAGVDMLEGTDGPQVMEVNSSPGLEGIEAATGIDVADRIVRHIEEAVLFPHFDLRQRLTVTKGFAVAEVPIPDKSPLVNQSLRETDLHDRGIHVLNIQRQSTTIPVPAADTKLLAGDVLVCYGATAAMKGLLPARKKKKKKKKRAVQG